MKTVQVAIQDPEYADSIRRLLLEDGGRRVLLVATPDVTVGGVIIVDEPGLGAFSSLKKEQRRLVVVVRKESPNLSEIWDAGVRHVVFQGDPPQVMRVVVLGVELSLGSSAAA